LLEEWQKKKQTKMFSSYLSNFTSWQKKIKQTKICLLLKYQVIRGMIIHHDKKKKKKKTYSVKYQVIRAILQIFKDKWKYLFVLIFRFNTRSIFLYLHKEIYVQILMQFNIIWKRQKKLQKMRLIHCSGWSDWNIFDYASIVV
jgi:hypothetical protein